MSLPNIYEYDRTAYGAGSGKDGDRLSGADLRNLESMGYGLQDIVDYSENLTAAGATKQGAKAQAQLDRYKEQIAQQLAEEEAARKKLEEEEAARKKLEEEEAKKEGEENELESSSGSDESNGSGSSTTTTTISTGGNGSSTSTTTNSSGNNVISGNDIGDGAAVVAGNGSSAVGGNNVVEDIFNQDKEFRFDVGKDAVIVNTGNMNSDLSNNFYSNSMFNAGSATDRSTAFDNLAAALAFQASASQGNPAPAGMSATTGDYSGIPSPLDAFGFAQSSFQSNIGEIQANANFFGNSVFGRYYPIATADS